MKKVNILMTLTLGVLSLGSCMDKDWDKEIDADYTIWNKDLVEHNVISINELKNQHAGVIGAQNKFEKITDDCMLHGVVVCTDDGGNLTQQITIQDGTEDNPGFLIIGVNQDALYNHIQPGQEVIFSLKDVYIGGYGSNGQLGYPSKNDKEVTRIGRMSTNDFWSRIKFVGAPDSKRVKVWEYNDVKNLDKDQWAGVIVHVRGTITPKNAARKFLAPAKDADAGNGVTTTINIEGGGTLDLRTSTYADFANFPIEDGRVYDLYGQLGRYTTSWQLSLRTMDDIK